MRIVKDNGYRPYKLQQFAKMALASFDHKQELPDPTEVISADRVMKDLETPAPGSKPWDTGPVPVVSDTPSKPVDAFNIQGYMPGSDPSEIPRIIDDPRESSITNSLPGFGTSKTTPGDLLQALIPSAAGGAQAPSFLDKWGKPLAIGGGALAGGVGLYALMKALLGGKKKKHYPRLAEIAEGT